MAGSVPANLILPRYRSTKFSATSPDSSRMGLMEEMSVIEA